MIVAITKGGTIAGIWVAHFAPTAPSFLIAGIVSLLVLELLPNLTTTPISLALIDPVYYLSIRLAGRRSANGEFGSR